MLEKKTGEKSSKAIQAVIKKEMAKPRVAKSAREKYARLALPVVLSKGRPPGWKEVEGHFKGEF
jgi:hypothetical protein